MCPLIIRAEFFLDLLNNAWHESAGYEVGGRSSVLPESFVLEKMVQFGDFTVIILKNDG